MNREEILAVLDQGYAARQTGDVEALLQFWAPGARYQMIGDPELLPGVPVGPMAVEAAAGPLVDLFTFHATERIQAIVEDRSAMVRWRITVSVKGSEPIVSELWDLWEFDAEGKAISLVQLSDTAAMRQRLI